MTSVDLEEYAENHAANHEPVRSHIESYIPVQDNYDLQGSAGAKERQAQTQQSIQVSQDSRWECEYNLLSGENERLKTKVTTLESALAFTEQTRDADADIRKIAGRTVVGPRKDDIVHSVAAHI